MKAPKRSVTPVEPLETRIAPASITFTDTDGQLVTVFSSKGTADQLEQIAILVDAGSGQQLQELRLTDLPDVFRGANISVTKGTLEDAFLVNVGFINGDGLDLGKLTIDGDLGRILAGDDNAQTRGATFLKVGSM